MTVIKCSNCGSRYRIVLFPIQKIHRRSALESVQPFFSNDWLGEISRFFWFMAGNRPIKQTSKLIVESVIRTSKHQILINQCEIPANTKDLRQLYITYIERGLSWSRNNSTNGGVTQSTHLKIQRAFLELRFLERVNSTQYTLTNAGNRFLRHFGDA